MRYTQKLFAFTLLTLLSALPFQGATTSAHARNEGTNNQIAMDNDTLDLTGDWKLTYGYTLGLMTDDTPVRHIVPDRGTSITYDVHFDPDGPGDYGMKYKGYYKGYGSHPLGQSGALVAETFYAQRGVYVVQIREHSPESFQYFGLLSGKHQHYSLDPERVEIVGAWVDIGGYIANFVMVKIQPQS